MMTAPIPTTLTGRFVLCAWAVLAALTWPASAARADDDRTKIGVIDSQRIISEYQDARDAEAVFEEEMRQWQQELQEMERAILTEREKIRSQALLLTKEKLDEMQTALDQKIQTYEGRKQELFDPTQGQAVKRNQELSDPINQQIMTVVERIGAEGDYDLILDRATINVVFVADGIDLTEQVLEELEKGGS